MGMRAMPIEYCAICGCRLHRTRDTYATPTIAGRSHATAHHFVAERFFGRTANRRTEEARDRIFDACPWDVEGQSDVFCYECHEELLHNPVLLPEDLSKFAELAGARDLNETEKTCERIKLAGRIILLHDVIRRGLDEMLAESRANPA